MISTADLSGRLALVTGGGRGIGRAIALVLAEAGASIAVNFRDHEQSAKDVVDRIRKLGRKAIAVRADVSEAAAVGRMMAAIDRELGAVDVLINNAGIALKLRLEELTEADFDRTIAVNLKSAFLCTQAVLPHMRTQRFGRIVNISSGAARGAGVVGVHYNASKAGMEGLTRGYAARLVKEGITVNAVAPSLIKTDMLADRIDAAAAAVPLGRPGHPDEVAQIVLMVIGNPYLTGQTIQVNGGLHFN
jgi:3-oxoacyl-[acyl-carrier protein] reductase